MSVVLDVVFIFKAVMVVMVIFQLNHNDCIKFAYEVVLVNNLQADYCAVALLKYVSNLIR